jgi:hypothetical protein
MSRISACEWDGRVWQQQVIGLVDELADDPGSACTTDQGEAACRYWRGQAQRYGEFFVIA